MFTAFATLGLVMCGHSVLETARDALFLESLPVSQLPWVYLIIAALTFAITGLESRVASGVRRRDVLALFLTAAAGVTASLWVIADFVSVSSIWILYVWTGVFGTLATIHFWLSLGAAFTVTQAKRLFGFVGAGALVGAICGSALARLLVSLAATRNLVLLSASAMLLAALCAHFGLRRSLRKATEKKGEDAPLAEPVRMRDAIASLRDAPYARLVVTFILCATVAITLADYLFKRQVAESIAPHDLGSFFATFNVVINVIALLAQVVLVGWLLDRIGVHRTLGVLPALLCAGGIWAALGNGLSAVVLLKGADGSLKHSLHRTATEVLFVPLSGRERDRVKTVADVVGHRGGQAIGSVLILVFVWMLDATAIAWTIAGMAIAAMFVAHYARGPYLDVFRRRLGVGPSAPTRLAPLDKSALESLFIALSSARERDVLAAIDVLREQDRADLLPPFVLHHPSAKVVRAALDCFVDAKRADIVPTALRVLDTDDADLRAAILRAIAAVSPDEEVLRAALGERSRRVRATAIVELTALGRMNADEARDRLRELSEHPGVRRAVAAALAARPCAALSDLLAELARDPDASVRAEATNAIAVSGDRSLWPVMLYALRERALRPHARRGFAAAGDDGLEFLRRALEDEELPHTVRLHVPRSMSLFDGAAPALFARLAREHDAAVRYKILRALGTISQRVGALELDHEALDALLGEARERCERIASWHRALETPELASGAVLSQLLVEELSFEREQVFRLLALRQPSEDFQKIHRGLESADPVTRASSQELLREILPHDAAAALIEIRPREEMSLDEALAEMIEGESEAIAAMAAAFGSQIGAGGLLSRIEARAEHAPELAPVFERAARRLTGRPSGVSHA